MYRTVPWSERNHAQKQKATPFREVFEFKPLSDVFHDSSTDLTDKFDKASIKVKAKEKTRGVSGVAEQEAELARDPSPEPLRAFHVSEKSWQVFKALFYMPGNKSQPSSMRWPAVVGALVDLGFAAEQMQGSQWQFEPSPELNLSRGIGLHAPHTGGDEVSPEMARYYGRRLNRAYGWDGSMFKTV